MAESGFEKWVIMGDSLMAVSIIGVSGFAEMTSWEIPLYQFPL
jgi:hypothetical protein